MEKIEATWTLVPINANYERATSTFLTFADEERVPDVHIDDQLHLLFQFTFISSTVALA